MEPQSPGTIAAGNAELPRPLPHPLLLHLPNTSTFRTLTAAALPPLPARRSAIHRWTELSGAPLARLTARLLAGGHIGGCRLTAQGCGQRGAEEGRGCERRIDLMNENITI